MERNLDHILSLKSGKGTNDEDNLEWATKEYNAWKAEDEIVEIKDHPWFVSVQFHPELKSRIIKSHPLFNHFVNKFWLLYSFQQKTYFFSFYFQYKSHKKRL